MTFLAPWALIVAGFGGAVTIVLHLVARQRPAAYLLPTARFIPDRQSLVSRVATRPRDLLLLFVRLLLLASAGAAFARPIIAPTRTPTVRVVVADRSRRVASAAEVEQRLQALARDAVPTTVIYFDSTASAPVTLDAALATPSTHASGRAPGSLTAALVAARRTAATVGRAADSVSLVVLSPLADEEIDGALDVVRGQWPGRIGVERLRASDESAVPLVLDRALPTGDVLYPALADVAVAPGPRAMRITRGAPGPADSAFARAGGTLVAWDPTSARPVATALVVGDNVVVATFGRGVAEGGGRTVARWGDGTPAATERELGAGCIRRVAVSLPIAGDLPLRASFKRIVRGLSGPCVPAMGTGAAVDTAAVGRVEGTGPLASGAALSAGLAPTAPLVPWLLGLAMLCAIAELALRRRDDVAPA